MLLNFLLEPPSTTDLALEVEARVGLKETTALGFIAQTLLKRDLSTISLQVISSLKTSPATGMLILEILRKQRCR